MKVKLTIELDLPEECAAYSADELRQLLFDVYVNYVRRAHLLDAVYYMDKGQVGSPDETPVLATLGSHHRLWAKICKSAVWDVSR